MARPLRSQAAALSRTLRLAELVIEPLIERQHRLGHAAPAMSLGVYGHVPDDLDSAVAGRLDRLFVVADGRGAVPS